VPNPRGWASVDVEKNGRKFRFATTHLETQDPVQFPQADDLINGAGNTTLPVVFVGDFNVTADSAADPTFPVYQKFINANFVDAWPLNRPGLTCCQAANLRNPASLLTHRLDLVLFRGQSRSSISISSATSRATAPPRDFGRPIMQASWRR
jgi:endonuclease/exonuclease/phosphatase family metal-dependent hydrolase